MTEQQPPTNAKPRRTFLRRMLRVRLWHLLLLMTLLAIPLGTVIQTAKRESDAYKFLKAHRAAGVGDASEFAKWFPPSVREMYNGMLFADVTEVAFDWRAINPKDKNRFIESVKALPNLESLRLEHAYINTEFASCLKNKPKLKELQLRWANIEPEVFLQVSRLAEVEIFDCWGALFHGKGWFTPSRFPKLKIVRANGSLLTDKAVQELCELDLEELDLSNCILTDAAFEKFSQLKSLSKLRLGGAKLSGESIRRVSQLPNLKRLELTNCDIDDAGLFVLASGSSKLSWLDLTSCKKLTDQCVDSLLRLENLSTLSVRGTNLSQAALIRLAEHPKLESIGCDTSQESLRYIEVRKPKKQDYSKEFRDFLFEQGPVPEHVMISEFLGLEPKHVEMLQPGPIAWLAIEGNVAEDTLQTLCENNPPKALEIEDASLSVSSLPNAPKLESLRLTNLKIEGDLFKKLNDYPKLTELRLAVCEISDLDFSSWKIPTTLESLDLSEVLIDSNDLMQLAKLPNLSDLVIQTEPNFELLSALSSNPSLDLTWSLPSPVTRANMFCSLSPSYDSFVDLEYLYGQEYSRLLALWPQTYEARIDNPSLAEFDQFSRLKMKTVRIANVQPGGFQRLGPGQFDEVRQLSIRESEISAEILASVLKEIPTYPDVFAQIQLTGTDADFRALQGLSDRPLTRLWIEKLSDDDLRELIRRQIHSGLKLCGTNFLTSNIAEAITTSERGLSRATQHAFPDMPITAPVLIEGWLQTDEISKISNLFVQELSWVGKEKNQPPEELGDVKSLTRLTIVNSRVTKRTMQTLAGLSQLQSLSFMGCKLEADSTAELKHMPRLNYLGFHDSRIESEALRGLRLPLEASRVDFWNCDFADSTGIRQLVEQGESKFIIAGFSADTPDLTAFLLKHAFTY